MLHNPRRAALTLATAAATITMLTAGAAVTATATAAPSRAAAAHPAFHARAILSGQQLSHRFRKAGAKKWHTEHLSLPDDITALGPGLFTAFQNGVGPQGQAAPDGNRDSTVVEFTRSGHPVRQWDLHGKCDGLTADPLTGQVIATVNEDANSSVYTIGAATGQLRHYHYNRPLPHQGGTDAISIYHGQVLVSASAPGTTGKAAPQPAYPAVYQVSFDPASRVAHIRPVFYDEAKATVANLKGRGTVVRLRLTDPDSNEIVPFYGPRFQGDFMLTSQGDKEQIFLRRTVHPGLTVLRLSQSVDDTAWASGPGRIYTTDNGAGTVNVVTGPFRPGMVLVAVTPCDAGNAPATCPAPGFPANYLGLLDPWTGHISRLPVHGEALHPQGMLFAG
jgi:hypothetical protein